MISRTIHLQTSAVDSSAEATAMALSSLPACSQTVVKFPPHTVKHPSPSPAFVTRLAHVKPQSFLPLPRRLFLPSASAIWDALTGRDPAREASLAVRRGMQLFRQGDVSGSLVEFDKAIELDPRQKSYLWQRGLSLYYLNRFEEGAEQFRLDVAQNPNDTEESIWCFLCEAQLYGVEEARKRFLEVGQDSRPVMREGYNLFKDGGDPELLVSKFLRGRVDEYFYASLYAGLYHESQNDMDAAKHHIITACQSPYGSRSDDYMASLAKVHCLCRNWDLK
ncbi:TPR-like protein [Dioscorea alata]|uniref:TPR-like protein n=1 Tax=Dioscorea alata TaxID=55571 RepID=A0ACB7U439_DIOAL|nr:TPR-like protein [Dioscorea alata]